MQRIVSTPLGDFRVPTGVRFAVILLEATNESAAASGADGKQYRLLRAFDGAPTESLSAAAPSGSTMPAADTPLTRARGVRLARGNVELKLSAWAHEVGVPARELRRAIKANAVEHRSKPDGRDNKAKLISAEALESYLADVEAVRRGVKAPPAWWDAVHVTKRLAMDSPLPSGAADDESAPSATRRAA